MNFRRTGLQLDRLQVRLDRSRRIAGIKPAPSCDVEIVCQFLNRATALFSAGDSAFGSGFSSDWRLFRTVVVTGAVAATFQPRRLLPRRKGRFHTFGRLRRFSKGGGSPPASAEP